MLNLSLAVVVGYAVGRVIGGRIGYLNGKAEVSRVPRGEPPEEDLTKELIACGRERK